MSASSDQRDIQTATPLGVPSAMPERRLRSVERTAILGRLERDHGAPLAVFTASAGFGKTTVMLQWAGQVGRSAYLRLNEAHDDPAVLMSDLAVALGALEPIREDLAHPISGRALEPGLQAATRLAEAVSGFHGLTLLLIDDIHVLRDRRAADALSVVIELLPTGFQVAVAGHDASLLHLARMRAADQLVEIGESQLAFGADETTTLAQLLDVPISREEVAAIMAETSGWPVAVSLALHSLASDRRAGKTPSSVSTRSVAEYIRSELLDPLDEERRSWLLRSSALETMSGPLCDAAMEVSGSLATLRQLERSSLLVQPVDNESVRYRYHPLLRRQLQDELELVSPGEARVIAARAAAWHDGQGAALEALDYARASEDRDLMAGLMARHVWALHWSGRIASLERWVEWFDEDGIRERYPSIAVLAGFLHAIDGRRHEAELWLAAARNATALGPMPEGSTREAWVAILSGMLMADGVEAVAADARIAQDGMRGDSPFMPGVRLLCTVASIAAGRLDEASGQAREAVELAEARGALPGYAMAAGLETVLALRAGEEQRARRLIESSLETLRQGGLVEYSLSGLVHAVAARLAMLDGSSSRARHHMAHVHRVRPMMTAATPWLSLPLRLEAIEALIALGDIASARTLMREAEDIRRVRPSLGTFGADADAMRERLDRLHDRGFGQSTLTTAELRVLQYLPTHLTFGEIADRLYVSPHTVKSQAVAIYGKLGVSSRRAAIETAVDYGLLDRSVLRLPLGPGVDAGIG